MIILEMIILELILLSIVVGPVLGYMYLVHRVYMNSRIQILVAVGALVVLGALAYFIWMLGASPFATLAMDCCYGPESIPLIKVMRAFFFLTSISAQLFIASAISLGFLTLLLARLGNKVFGSVVAACIVMLTGASLIWFNLETLTDVVPEAKNVPVYPGASRVLVKGAIFSWDNEREITYTVHDTPDNVLNFYKEQLPKGGWTYQGTTRESTRPFSDFLHYSMQNPDSSTYILLVKAVDKSTHLHPEPFAEVHISAQGTIPQSNQTP